MDLFPGDHGFTWEFTNPTSNPISFHVMLSSQISTPAGSTPFTDTIVPVTLRPGGIIDFTPIQVPPSGYHFSGMDTPGSYIGTGVLGPNIGGIDFAVADNPLIRRRAE
jgi:hypothetical protein